MTNVAFIGIGAMGEPMAGNLLKKGLGVTIVKNRRPAPVDRLMELGAKVATTPAEAAAGADIVIMCLPTSKEVEVCVLGEHGLMAAMREGSVVLDCSTSDPASTRKLAAQFAGHKIGFVDAGMTRGVAGAKQGTLAFFLGGIQEHIDQAMPALGAMGDTFVHVGPVSHGHVAKVVSNVLSYATVTLVSESLALGIRNGVDGKKLFDALMQGAPSKALEAFGPRILKAEYLPPRVTVDHVCDDMVMAHSLAGQGNTPMFMLGIAESLYKLMAARGHGEADMAVIAELASSHGESR
jgi:3-hydroxyisobutyrate dehydrogenase